MPIMKRPSKERLLSLYTKEGLTDSEIARRLEVNPSTVYRWKQHYGIETDIKQLFQVRVKRGGE